MADISFVLDRELAPLRDAVRRFLAGSAPASIAPAELWRMAVGQGWLGLLSDDESPRLGTLLMLESELGRVGAGLPLADMFWLTQAAREAGAGFELVSLASACSAGTPVSLAVVGCGSRVREEFLRFDKGRVDARVCNVDHVDLADTLLIVDPGASRLAAMRIDAPAVAVVHNAGFAARGWHDLRMKAAAAEVFEGVTATRWTADLLRVAASARAFGGAGRVFELICEYVRVREQFGQPIGKFQAVQHKLANLRIAVDACRLLLGHAASTFDAGAPDWRAMAACANRFAASVLPGVMLEAQHCFGAVGFMEEHPAPGLCRAVHANLIRLRGGEAAVESLAAAVLDEGAGAALFPAFDLGADSAAFREQVREWLAANWTADKRRSHHAGPRDTWGADRKFSESLGARGWIGLALPKEFGGQNRSLFEQAVFDEEMSRVGAPTYAHGCARLLAPSVLRFGTPEQRARYLPPMLNGRAVFCLGYSEPNAGSDLASLKTRAVRDGDDWIIQGSKIWTTFGSMADYVWLAARTDPELSRNKGISVFIVPMNTPGISFRPLEAMNGHQPCAVFYDNVRVPQDALIGGLNQGWTVITSALAQERVLMGGSVARLVPDFLAFVDEVRRLGLSGDPMIRMRIAGLAAELQAARLLQLQSITKLDAGGEPIAEAAISKVFSSELEERMAEIMFESLGPETIYSHDAPAALMEGRAGHGLAMGLMHVIGGGANEIQRNIIAQAGLGLPR